MVGISDMHWHLGQDRARVDAELARWHRENRTGKLWEKDAGLWTGQDEAKWLGWLDSVIWMQPQAADLMAFSEKVRQDGFTDVLVLGMGGSSLCPEVLAMSFDPSPGAPKLHVLDSTVPEQVRRFRDQVPLETTLCIVASKSGTTTEPNTFCDYFWAEVVALLGSGAGNNFVAITDPDSTLHRLAQSRGFRCIFLGRPEIGGRFSALSPFGLVPAALLGIDLHAFLKTAEEMVTRCKNSPTENPGIALGVALGVLAGQGKDKLTLVTGPKIWDFGAWLEQLIAESTGKAGVGIVPIDQEELCEPKKYGTDRLFVQIRLTNQPDAVQDQKVSALIAAGFPVIQIDLPDVMALGAEFFRWEIATAAAGAVMQIHPFNQPNVQESKDFTAKLTTAYEADGVLPIPAPSLKEGDVAVFVDKANTDIIVEGDFSSTLATHLSRIKPGDYVAICAYLDMREDVIAHLKTLRQAIRDRFDIATTLGFGPRFLHSTGQLHKGGADTVLVLQITAEDMHDLEIPGRRFSFGVLKNAQALGDASALSLRHRRAMRIHLMGGVIVGIQKLIAFAKRG
jgi:transaldolase / glucose-6-phosphate isomerase